MMNYLEKIPSPILVREATKKKMAKNFPHVGKLGGGQQILVWEPQKSAFFRANLPKNMLKLIHNVPFVCLYKIQSLNSFKIPDAGFLLYILPFIRIALLC